VTDAPQKNDLLTPVSNGLERQSAGPYHFVLSSFDRQSPVGRFLKISFRRASFQSPSIFRTSRWGPGGFSKGRDHTGLDRRFLRTFRYRRSRFSESSYTMSLIMSFLRYVF
jgi:hypothetical protein